ncbi:hypothetical protein GLOIN_2v1771599 [Rhizophagus irregularis DAOM 181602=DAOM 197198]|nr:hypothetical protein GLOIN_2v1771599 [Rhizophagus irregularis DAOM 181602=DAOM 197198]
MLNLSSKESELTESELTELELTQYLEGIKEFGFNHIIIVGERDYRVTITEFEVDKNLSILVFRIFRISLKGICKANPANLILNRGCATCKTHGQDNWARPDFSSIKSNNTILDYGPCGECDIPILTEDPPRLLVLNVCDDMIHRTCAKAMYKDGTLLCSCDMADNSDPLLPFQYSIVDYGGREKSSISGSERLSFVNLKNLGYNILKSLEDKTVRDITFPKLDLCSECGNDILMSPLKAFLYLTCGHIFHKLCIEKKTFS